MSRHGRANGDAAEAKSVGAVTLVAAALGILAVLGLGTTHIVTLLTGTATVALPLPETWAEVPLGPDGALVEAGVDEALVSAGDVPAAGIAALVGGEILAMAAWAICLLCAVVFCRTVMRGRFFDRASVRALEVAVAALSAGWILGGLLRHLGASIAASALSDGTSTGLFLDFDYTALIGLLILVVVAFAFRRGAQLQRDTEGLV